MKRVVLGPRAVLDALRGAPEQVAVVYHDPAAGPDARAAADAARDRNVRSEERAAGELDALAGARNHEGVLAITGEYPYRTLDDLLARGMRAPLFVALDQITDPHNFGAIVRSAVAFGADGVLTLKDRAAPVTPVVVRASAGATELAAIARVTNLARTLEDLADTGMQVVGLDAAGSVEIAMLPYPSEGRVLVIGSEGDGLRRLVRERCQQLARIPMRGAIQSLNASVAAAIALYECARARQAA
jgi:23S rRNA (guanosine2251-2'-O)-methyltransferase